MNQPVRVKLSLDEDIRNMMVYIWNLFGEYIGFETNYVQENFDISIGREQSDVTVSSLFIENIRSKKFHHSDWFNEEPVIRSENGQIDYLGTCFYMINCLQERYFTALDGYGRFPFSASYQYKFKCNEKPLVNQLFLKLYQGLPPIANHYPFPRRKSQAVITHDIDSLYQSKYQDTKFALKNFQFSKLATILRQELSGNPGFCNVMDIVDIEQSLNAKSIFFWIPNRGRVAKDMVQNRAINSDYKISGRRVQKMLKYVRKHGSENGLHKSISFQTHDQEIEKLGYDCIGNRNHYLRFAIPDHFDQLEASSIRVDYSLGFAEAPGFRNSFSLPFKPYNFTTGKSYSFIEVPMQIMDVTFNHYMNIPRELMKERILQFILDNQYNSLLNILWHNSYFSKIKFAGFREMFVDILSFLNDRGIEPVLSEDIVKKFK